MKPEGCPYDRDQVALLFDHIQNTRRMHESAELAVKHLLGTARGAARVVAKERREWYDDAEEQTINDWNALPWRQQFPEEVIVATVMALAEYHAKEIQLQWNEPK